MLHKTALKVLKLRQNDPTIMAIRIAERLDISKERVRQILLRAGLATRVPLHTISNHPAKAIHPTNYRPTPIEHPPATPALIWPVRCPKCQGTMLYEEQTVDGPEIWCFTCGNMVAFTLDRTPQKKVTCPI